MPRTESWKELYGGDGKDLVLAIDFPVTGRPEGTFSDMYAGMEPDYSIWETTVPEADGQVSAERYVTRWSADARNAGRRIRGVLGYCAGSVFAAELARRISEWQNEPPEVVLFDPEVPTGRTLYIQFHQALETMVGVLTPDEIADVRAEGQSAHGGKDDLVAYGAALGKIFREAGHVAFQRIGLDADRGEELVGTFLSFLTWLAVTTQIDPTAIWARSVAVTSATSTNGLNTVPPEARDGIVARELRFDVEHRDLLRTAEVGRAVTELLARRGR
ncbi:hypothetical protein [Streptomyces malaysiensis]|uniref:hypothetical protein n=1 Tax=Streptomyces malaysiensis TaxID=92644 RepID=UPI0033334B02